jgi:hypothetical protein
MNSHIAEVMSQPMLQGSAGRRLNGMACRRKRTMHDLRAMDDSVLPADAFAAQRGHKPPQEQAFRANIGADLCVVLDPASRCSGSTVFDDRWLKAYIGVPVSHPINS